MLRRYSCKCVARTHGARVALEEGKSDDVVFFCQLAGSTTCVTLVSGVVGASGARNWLAGIAAARPTIRANDEFDAGWLGSVSAAACLVAAGWGVHHSATHARQTRATQHALAVCGAVGTAARLRAGGGGGGGGGGGLCGLTGGERADSRASARLAIGAAA